MDAGMALPPGQPHHACDDFLMINTTGLSEKWQKHATNLLALYHEAEAATQKTKGHAASCLSVLKKHIEDKDFAGYKRQFMGPANKLVCERLKYVRDKQNLQVRCAQGSGIWPGTSMQYTTCVPCFVV